MNIKTNFRDPDAWEKIAYRLAEKIVMLHYDPDGYGSKYFLTAVGRVINKKNIIKEAMRDLNIECGKEIDLKIE